MLECSVFLLVKSIKFTNPSLFKAEDVINEDGEIRISPIWVADGLRGKVFDDYGL